MTRTSVKQRTGVGLVMLMAFGVPSPAVAATRVCYQEELSPSSVFREFDSAGDLMASFALLRDDQFGILPLPAGPKSRVEYWESLSLVGQAQKWDEPILRLAAENDEGGRLSQIWRWDTFGEFDYMRVLSWSDAGELRKIDIYNSADGAYPTQSYERHSRGDGGYTVTWNSSSGLVDRVYYFDESRRLERLLINANNDVRRQEYIAEREGSGGLVSVQCAAAGEESVEQCRVELAATGLRVIAPPVQSGTGTVLLSREVDERGRMIQEDVFGPTGGIRLRRSREYYPSGGISRQFYVSFSSNADGQVPPYMETMRIQEFRQSGELRVQTEINFTGRRVPDAVVRTVVLDEGLGQSWTERIEYHLRVGLDESAIPVSRLLRRNVE